MKKKSLICAGILFVAIFTIGALSSRGKQISLSKEAGSFTETESGEQAEYEESQTPSILVHICGAVQNPGVYELSEGCRLYEAVDAAGGFSMEASSEKLNLVSVLEDGDQIRIPTMEEEANEAEETNGLININTADVSRLCEIPGIGETRAEAIIAYRESNGQFHKPEDIMSVSGIKESLYEKMSPYITVQ